MKKFLLASLVCSFLAGGCASTGQLRKIESAGERNEKILHDTEQRVRNLEQDVSALGRQINELGNRTYEVRTGSGRKTGMKIMPVSAQQTKLSGNQDARTGMSTPQNASVPEGQANFVAPATAPILTPSVPPLHLPSGGKDSAPVKNFVSGPKTNALVKSGQKTDKISPPSKQQRVAGPSGSLGVEAPDQTAVALPPAETPAIPLPSAELSPRTEQKSAAVQTPSPTSMPSRAVPPAAAVNGGIPVPSLPLSDLPLPPEHPDLPPVAMPAQEQAAAPATPQAPIPPETSAISGAAAGETRTKDTAGPSPKAGQGEEAVYKAALKLAMSGRSAEGISQFRSFLQQYPNGRYAVNAEYWIGECLYAQRNHKDALAQFQLVNTRYAAHHKNADALLKAGMTLNRLGDRQGAAEKYRTLLTAFPNSEAARRARDLGLVH
ncbi:MAG: tol-pal system protein YbgF [Desulfovibrio sp.]|nr:tol-pal system protein YbgF [Desulfovibrio sp.]